MCLSSFLSVQISKKQLKAHTSIPTVTIMSNYITGEALHHGNMWWLTCAHAVHTHTHALSLLVSSSQHPHRRAVEVRNGESRAMCFTVGPGKCGAVTSRRRTMWGTTPLSSGTEIRRVYRTFKMSDPIMSSHHPNYPMPSDTLLTLWSLYTYNYMLHFARVEAR